MTTFDHLTSALELASATPERFVGHAAVEPDRLVENRFVIDALLDAPAPSRLERVLRRVGVADLTVPLVTATPALRRGWLAAVGVASLFALSAARNSTAEGFDRLQLFLAVAPLVPLLGVALAFGPSSDPAHETVVAAPVDAFRVFVIRATTVLAASIVAMAVVTVLLPGEGVARVAWLLPALAVTSAASALSTRLDTRVASAVVAAVWLAFVVVVTSASSAEATFGAGVQWTSALITAVGVAIVVTRRRSFDVLAGSST